MEAHAAIEDLKKFIIIHDLPRAEMALFGIQCPYCGKSDRIRELDAPESLVKDLEPDHVKIYADLWQRLNPLSDDMGVCRFCQNPLKLFPYVSRAEALDAD